MIYLIHFSHSYSKTLMCFESYIIIAGTTVVITIAITTNTTTTVAILCLFFVPSDFILKLPF